MARRRSTSSFDRMAMIASPPPKFIPARRNSMNSARSPGGRQGCSAESSSTGGAAPLGPAVTSPPSGVRPDRCVLLEEGAHCLDEPGELLAPDVVAGRAEPHDGRLRMDALRLG